MRANSVMRASATSTAFGSRWRRVCSIRLICEVRTAVLSMSRMSIGSSFSSRNLLTPTITSSPLSTAAWRRVAASSIRRLGRPSSTALVMPPMASTSSIKAQAFSASSLVRLST
ncbi:hypothetical protein D3C72_2043700 [compost metagenome]